MASRKPNSSPNRAPLFDSRSVEGGFRTAEHTSDARVKSGLARESLT